MRIKQHVLHAQFLIILIASGCSIPVNNATETDRLPQIFPDYTSLVIPSNISPLNFFIEETGSEYIVEIYSESGSKIKIRQTSPNIIIPAKKWKTMLENNKGNCLNIDVYVKQDNWLKYNRITDTIAQEPIDNNLVYRLIGLIYQDKDKLGIYQHNLENFEESVILENTSNPDRPCINCHSFSNNNPEKMSMHIRKSSPGTLIYSDGNLTKYNTKTEFTMSPAAYTAWHPNGNLIAFSLNRLFVYFTSDEHKLVEVCDKASDLVVYNLSTNTISTSPGISSPGRETSPNWSPDGKWLYYISATKTTADMTSWVNARYDLMRVSYDADKNIWGEPETLISSKETGMSITWPAASPDGRYIVFCMIDHSYFSIFDKNSDLYLYDLTTNTYSRADALNSPYTDSYHSWSKNGRWIVFSSKRLDELATRPYFAYFDSSGTFHKPFVLPQEDPLFYRSFQWNYNIPVLVDGKVTIDTTDLKDMLTSNTKDVLYDNSVRIDTISEENHGYANYY